MRFAQYADKGTKIKGDNTIALQWPLIGGALVSSDTTRLGPIEQQATYIDEEYLNDNGEKTSVSKALYPDGYRSISILTNGQEFNQGYRPDGSINYTISPEQFKKDTMNYFDYTRLIPKGEKGLKGGIQPGVYYVNFPTHSIALKNGSEDTSSDDAWDATAGNFDLPLGHAGVMTVGADGVTKYYEYGRYSNGGRKGALIGAKKSYKDGNWRNVEVSNVHLTENGEMDHERLANDLAKQFGEKVELTFVNNADPSKTLEAINADAKNRKRKSYNLATKTCGSAACSVIDAGQSGWEQFGDGVKRVLNAGNPIVNFVRSAVNGQPQYAGSFRSIFGGLTPSAKQEGLQAAGYTTYSSK